MLPVVVGTKLNDHVRFGNWERDRSALEVRRYSQDFECIKISAGKVLNRENAGNVADDDHESWYRDLFGPSVTEGILIAADLAGFRNGPVYIRRSMHIPLSNDAVREVTPAFFYLLSNDPPPAVRAVLGHFVYAGIHPAWTETDGPIGF